MPEFPAKLLLVVWKVCIVLLTLAVLYTLTALSRLMF